MGRKRKSAVEIYTAPLEISSTVPTFSKTLSESSTLPTGVASVDDIDRVNNVLHKEKALSEAGVTRRKVYSVIKELLEATKEETVSLGNGMEEVQHVPDLDKRKMGAELALKAFGDLKEFQSSMNNVTYNKVVYQWLKEPSSPTRLPNE